MSKYSFITEALSSPVSYISSTAGMGSLGSLSGGFIGKHSGYLASRLKNRNLDSSKIKWNDPVFSELVKQDLVTAKNSITQAKEWYLSCDKQDRKAARLDYERAILEYQSIQKDVAERNPQRWIEAYKAKLAENTSKRFSKFGAGIGATAAMGATIASHIKANRK